MAGRKTNDDVRKIMAEVKADDRQVGGTHYSAGAIQHWDFVIAQGWGYAYLAGQITKYVTRAPNKNGLEDLKKARHFLDKLIESVEEGLIDEISP